MDPITAFKGLQAGAALAGGLKARADGLHEKARLESEARLAETQALQRDTASRDELGRFLSTVRSARAANGLSSLSPNARMLETEAREDMGSERLRIRADYRQKAANYRAAAKSAGRGARLSLVTGVARAAIPLGQLGAYRGT